MNPIDHLNNTVWATLRPSSIHGVGVFAIRDIPKGTLIADHSVHNINLMKPLYRMNIEDFKRLVPEIQKLILDRTCFLRRDTFFCFYSPNAEATLQSFMNHSETPNTEASVALRDIHKGEELTEDFTALSGGEALHALSLANYHFLPQHG